MEKARQKVINLFLFVSEMGIKINKAPINVDNPANKEINNAYPIFILKYMLNIPIFSMFEFKYLTILVLGGQERSNCSSNARSNARNNAQNNARANSNARNSARSNANANSNARSNARNNAHSSARANSNARSK